MATAHCNQGGDKRMLYLITHGYGRRKIGKGNPKHTTDGLLQFVGSMAGLVQSISEKRPPLAVVGEGRRFLETYRLFLGMGMLERVPVKFSMFCGTETSRQDKRTGTWIALGDGTMASKKSYIGMADVAVDWWKAFINPLPNRTVLFSGSTLMKGLGAKESASCSLYIIHRQVRAIYCAVRHGESAGCERVK